MRPPVLDRVERGRSWSDTGNDPSTKASTPRPRGPRHRPTLQLWENATWRARMRAWCNQIKSAILAEEHDASQPQTYRVTQSPHCPIESASTWLKWWDGEAVPQPRHVKTAEKLAAQSAALLDLDDMHGPITRQLMALDIVTTKFRKSGSPSVYKRARAERLVRGLNEAWVSFIDTTAPSRTNRFSVENQLGESAEALLGPVEVPPHRIELARRFGGNRARWALPNEVLNQHNWLEPLSIYRFLSMLAISDMLDNPRLMKLWALDLASATLAVRALIETADLRRPKFWNLRMGIAGGMQFLTTYAFCAPHRFLDAPETKNMAANVYGNDAEQALVNLRAARECYYETFRNLGVPESALRALNDTHHTKSWDGAFAAPRVRL